MAITVLLDLALIIVLARLLGAAVRRLGQPAVIGEVFAGILVGPTLFHGALATTLFPMDARPALTMLADVGVVVFMFLIGLEFDRDLLRGRGRVVVTVSAGSMVLPFGFGVLVALYLLQHTASAHQLGFVLFMGAAMSVTAFPVLARILADRGMSRTPIGGLALTCAAVDDVVAWSLLAAVVTLAGVGAPSQWRILLVVPYAALMILVVRPMLRTMVRSWRRSGQLSAGMLATIFAGALTSGALTEWMGLHFIFGAFLFGVVMPREGADQLRAEIQQRVGQVSSVLLLPVFFVVAGLNVNLSTLDTTAFGDLLLIMLAAIGGKFGGTFLGARLHGMPARSSATLAVLMNTRGLTELIILSVGLQLGVLDGRLYSLMVVMAVVTTAMAGPLLALLYPRGQVEADRAAVIRAGGDLSAPVG